MKTAMKELIKKYISVRFMEDEYGSVSRIEHTKEQFTAHLENAVVIVLRDLIDRNNFTTSNGELVIDVQDVELIIKDLEQ
jgi:hypothetical protein